MDNKIIVSDSCFNSLFSGCTTLLTAPDLLATTLTDYCYFYMFENCTSLKRITCLATDINAKDCTYHWNENVSSSGTFYCKEGVSWIQGKNGIPVGWKRVNI